jgi:hypothetical protein
MEEGMRRQVKKLALRKETLLQMGMLRSVRGNNAPSVYVHETCDTVIDPSVGTTCTQCNCNTDNC